MTILEMQLKQVLPAEMNIPDPIRELFNWIEQQNMFMDRNGQRVGFLYPHDLLLESWTETERKGGTYIEFYAQGNKDLRYWLGNDRAEVLNRLCVFARTGGDGSMAAFWMDDNGIQRIVHLGSGSGSLLTCVLAENALDFLRLIAIGYGEICWNEYFAEPPNSGDPSNQFVHPNTEFQNWVKTTFKTTIPKTALEIVKNPSGMDDENSTDAFFKWVKNNNA